MKYEQAIIDVAGIPVRAYRDEGWNKFLYLTSVSEAIEKRHQSIGEFLRGKSPEALLCKAFSFVEIEAEIPNKPGIHRLTVIPAEVATYYWHYWAKRGNTLADALSLALMRESIDRRIEAAFGETKTELERNTIATERIKSVLERWNDAREEAKANHQIFQIVCERYRWNAAQVHNALTLKITGMTAAQHRKEFELIGDNPAIGLDHVQRIAEMQKIAKVKQLFGRYKKVTSWQERLTRAITDAECELA